MFKLWTSQILDFDQFNKQHCYCTCLRKMFKDNYTGKYNKCSATPLTFSIVLYILIWGSYKWFKNLFWWRCFSRWSYNVISLCCIFSSQGICWKNFPKEFPDALTAVFVFGASKFHFSKCKTLFQSRFFFIFCFLFPKYKKRFLLTKYKKFFNIWARKLHFLNYKKMQELFFRFSFIFWPWKVLS